MNFKDLTPKQTAQLIIELRRALSPICESESFPESVHIRAYEMPDGAVCAAARRNGELFLLIDVRKPLASRHLRELLHSNPKLMRGTEGDTDTYVINREDSDMPIEAIDLTIRALRQGLVAPQEA